MRKLAVVAVMFLVVAATGCKKTGEGEYEVERPTIGTTTDTVRTPSVEVGRETVTTTVPTVEVNPPRR